jgi:polyvinyl alcohol dehydrogenase (cytochrome)
MRRLAVALVLLAAPARAAITTADAGRLGVRWELVTSSPVTGAPVVDGDTLYATAWNGMLYARDVATGAEKWTAPLTAGILFGGPMVTGDLVCAGGANATVVCLNKTTGAEVWRRSLKLPDFSDAIWSPPVENNGRLFVSVASLSDQPCTRGRLVALDVATGDPLWVHQTIPDKICSTDTSVACTDSFECPEGGSCDVALGGGVTATVTVDPTGSFVYMNTVGCYTHPSVGDSDTVFKLDATTGATIWKSRVTPPEQFGYCANDTSKECSTDTHCAAAGVGGTCTNPKGFYHDFGFLNGPLRIDVPDGAGTRTLIVSGSKDGTLYAFDESTGDIAWTNEVQPVPVSPGFAGYGLFNGRIGYADGRIYAALNALIPARVCSGNHAMGCTSDEACGAAAPCLAAPEHLQAFDAATGATLWTHEIGRSWSSVGVADGVVYAGTNVQNDDASSQFFAVDAATGTRLGTYPVPSSAIGRPLVSGDTVFVPYGTLSNFGIGGVRAMALCGNGIVDPGESCDPGADRATGCCNVLCEAAPIGAACAVDDGDACTSAAACAVGICTGTFASMDDVGCTLDGLDAETCDGGLASRVDKALGKRVRNVRRLLGKLGRLIARSAPAQKIGKTRRAATMQLDAIPNLTGKAVKSRSAKRRITPECKATLDALAARSRAAIASADFAPAP